MKRTALGAVLILLLVGLAWPRNIQTNNARTVALNWMHMVPQFRANIYLPRDATRPILDKSRTTILAHVLELEPRGFILVAPDDRLFPILGFSFESKFDTTDSPENHLLLLLRQEMPLRLRALQESAIDASFRQQASDRWQSLANATATLQSKPADVQWVIEVGPFLSSHWGQDDDQYGNHVYNYYTPDHLYSGCVATAMCQLLYYHHWPVTGTGSHSYLWSDTTLAADFGATTYDWANMVDNYYTPGNESEIKRQAAGLLSYHAGIGLDMNYSSSGSGAFSTILASALTDFFRHHGEWVFRSSSDFFDRLYGNMLLYRPAVLSIRTDKNEGHAVNVDGVRHESTGPVYYHLNYGWDGYVDAWFDISGPWTAGGYNWTTIEGAIVDVQPLPDLVDPGSKLYSGDLTLHWDVGSNFSPSCYELQQAVADLSLSNFSDGAESGAGNWIIRSHWKQSSNQHHTGSYSFQGYIAETLTDYNFSSSMQLDRTIKIDATTQLTYYWGAYLFHNCEARFEISTDEINWKTLRTHTSTANKILMNWYQVIISASELAPYIGEAAQFRFTVKWKGSSYYYGSLPGFYVDDLTVSNAYLGTWTTVDMNIPSTSKSISVSTSGDYSFRVRSNWNSQWWPWSDVETVAIELPTVATLQVRAFLQGPYSGSGSMNTLLRDQSLIPADSPYSQAPATAGSIPANAVDWILLQLYESDGATVATSRSLFLRNDGQLMDDTGATPFQIAAIYKSRNYYLVLKHRNHVRVMSAATVNFASGSASYDFTDNISKYYGSAGARLLAVGTWGLWAGDVDQDGSVLPDDFSAWQTSARSGTTGYSVQDIRLDGQVTSADYVYWYENNRAGATTGMPNP